MQRLGHRMPLIAVPCLLAALALSGVAHADANLFPNGGFDGSTSGWGGYLATVSLASDGVGGGGAARVAASGNPASFSVAPVAKSVPSTVAGKTYTASGWVRSDRPGKTICVRIRETTSR